MSRRRTISLALCALWGALATGCALWQEEVSEPPNLPAAKMSPDTVTLEIAFVRMSGDALLRREELWRQVDEQQLPPELRLRMRENGLRAGLVSSQLPPLLRELLEEKADPLAVAGAGALPGGDVTASQRQLQSRAGKRGVILCGGKHAQLTLLRQIDGKVSGQSFMEAQCLFSVKTFPRGDGRVRLELIPEVEHGQPQQRFVGQDGAFRVESSKDLEVLDWLKAQLVLAPGDVLVLGAGPEAKGLGKQFFASATAGEEKLLLIRLAQTQYDDIFAPEKLRTPLATPSE